ncbi:MAG: efflux RND transporter periplasmic adaptor subunit [Burkholderiaceae bacterium]
MSNPHQRLAVLAVCAAAALLTACSKPAPAPEPVRAVKVMTVGLGGLQSSHEYAGEVRARTESRLGFRVGGKLIKRQVELGQRVKAGQMLAQLDAQDFRLAADAAKAQVASAQTNRDLAAADFKRFAELRAQNFISGAELERRETTLKAAQASLEQAQAQLSAQGNQTGYANLVADVSGVVTAVEAEPGQVLAAGAPVVRLAQDGARDVVFAVPEDQLDAVRVGARMQVRQWASDRRSSGVVREVAASADPITRTFGVKLTLAPGEAAAGDALPLGSTVYVNLESAAAGGPQVMKLPTSALLKTTSGSAVWLLDAATMTVKQQAVAVLTADGNEVVIASGLQPGAQVVVAGVHVLAQGQKVSLYQTKYDSNQPLANTNTAPSATQDVAKPAAQISPAAAK